MSEYGTQDVKCPFYLTHQEDQRRIKCEGPIKFTSTQLTFWKNQKEQYLKRFCCQNYSKCRIYKMLTEKYN